MRQIELSTDVFARIWSLRRDGEDTEDAILRRVLSQRNLSSDTEPQLTATSSTGIFDHRFRVHFPEGFEIERTYLGKSHRAVSRDGKWFVDGYEGGYTRLNQLSRVIGTKTENAWVNWFYREESGLRHPVSDLRDPDTISSRGRSGSSAWKVVETGKISGEKSNNTTEEKIRWCDDVKSALTRLRGRASLHSIYREVEKIRLENGRSVPPSLEATVRRTLEDFSSDSENFRGEDWFKIAESKGSGIWALRDG
jgi:hypothetical protein